MAVVNKCCCCCQLRTGVMVLGWFGLVSALFDLAASGALYANRYSILEGADPAFLAAFSTYFPVYIAYGVLALLIYILLAWGASSGNRFLLLPWLIMEMLSIIVAGLGVIIGGIVCLCIDWPGRGPVAAIIFGAGIPIVAFKIYIWLCVLSCFQELRDSLSIEQNVLLELPKPLENIITDYRPPEYERLENKEA